MKKLKKIKAYVLALLILILLNILALLGIFTIFRNKIFPNIFISEIYVGDTTFETAEDKLQQDTFIPQDIVLIAEGINYEIPTEKIQLNYDYGYSVQRAYNFSNSGNFIHDLITKLSLIKNPVNLGLKLITDEQKIKEEIISISSKLGTPAKYPSVTQKNGNVIVDPGQNGIEVDIEKTTEDVIKNISLHQKFKTDINFKKLEVELDDTEKENILKRGQKLAAVKILIKHDSYEKIIDPNTILSFLSYKGTYDENQLNTFILKVAKEINSSAQNSIFIFEEGVVKEFVPSKDGVEVEEKLLKNLLLESLEKIEKKDEKEITITIPVIITEAKVKNEDVNSLGIKTLLGRGVSYFRGSISNRVYNINHASSKFKGTLVAPGETFSFNSILGDVSALTGYKSAYVIKDGKTVLGDGGGVCQVSTTLFRAVLLAGLPIVERRPHSYRVGYYEQGSPPGLDATVYYPTTDFKFLNNTPAHILIQPVIDITKSTLVFEIYGTDDGRIVTTSKPLISSQTPPPEDLYIDDPTIPTGQIKQIEYKSWGAKVSFNYLVKKGEEILTQKTFVSSYQPWQAVYLRGTAPTQ